MFVGLALSFLALSGLPPSVDTPRAALVQRGFMGAEALPFIEIDRRPNVVVPPGYKAYIVRDWERYIVARAEAVTIRDGSRNELFFEYGDGGILTARKPEHPGELSHLFLPIGYDLPDAIAKLRAQPIPDVIASWPARPRVPIRFREEPLPPGAPLGSRAYRGEFDSFVFRGVVTGITGHADGGFVFDLGSDVIIRKPVPGSPDNVSHIIVPNGHTLPPEFIEE
ncbi:MAG: hypothetical protein JWM87_2820 [Candidatus Eremiobacteraeota bacterium]|nr:hypothetical protein [Candidatus Eremiobacteraeota bacterium]